MADDKSKRKGSPTLLGFRALSQGKEPTEEQKLAMENHYRFMIALRKFIEHMIQYWKQWLILAISGSIGAEFSGLINMVD